MVRCRCDGRLDGNALTFTGVNDAQHGTLTVSSSGAVAYTPTANYAGADSFSVRVADGAGGEVTGTVNVTVATVNDAPAFTVVTFNTAEDTTLDGNLLPTDTDSASLTVTRTSAPQHGQATVSAAGLVNYLPSANLFAVTPAEGSRYVLRILSTQTLDYSIPVTGVTGTRGLTQFRWLPRP